MIENMTKIKKWWRKGGRIPRWHFPCSYVGRCKWKKRWHWKVIRSQYWKTLKEKLEKAKEIIPSTCRIGETIFTSMAIIGGRLLSNHHKNINHVHKDSKDLVSFIITIGGNISRGETVFYDGVKASNFGSRYHVLKHLNGRMIFGPFEKIHEGTLWREHRSKISFILTEIFFLHFYCHGDRFYNRYINKTDKKIILMMILLGWNQNIYYMEEWDIHRCRLM